MPKPNSSKSRRRFGRIACIRHAHHMVEPKVMRIRGMRVLAIGPWRLVYLPRDHWSNHL